MGRERQQRWWLRGSAGLQAAALAALLAAPLACAGSAAQAAGCIGNPGGGDGSGQDCLFPMAANPLAGFGGAGTAGTGANNPLLPFGLDQLLATPGRTPQGQNIGRMLPQKGRVQAIAPGAPSVDDMMACSEVANLAARRACFQALLTAPPNPTPTRSIGAGRKPQFETIARNTIERCWNRRGAHDPGVAAIDVRLRLNRNGRVQRADILDRNRMASDRNFRVLGETLLRATIDPACQPLALPADQYGEWQSLVVAFPLASTR